MTHIPFLRLRSQHARPPKAPKSAEPTVTKLAAPSGRPDPHHTPTAPEHPAPEQTDTHALPLDAYLLALSSHASARQLRQIAAELRREADALEARALARDADAAETERRAARHRARRDALQEVRDRLRAGQSLAEIEERHIAEIARRHDIEAEALALLARHDKRRWTAVEREERDGAIMRLYRTGHSAEEIAEITSTPVRTVRRRINELRRLAEETNILDLRRRFKPIAQAASLHHATRRNRP